MLVTVSGEVDVGYLDFAQYSALVYQAVPPFAGVSAGAGAGNAVLDELYRLHSSGAGKPAHSLLRTVFYKVLFVISGCVEW